MPLEMSDRVSLPPAEIPGESILAELPTPQGLLVFDVLRAVLLVVQKIKLAPLYSTLALDRPWGTPTIRMLPVSRRE